jgi:hypothetical protein
MCNAAVLALKRLTIRSLAQLISPSRSVTMSEGKPEADLLSHEMPSNESGTEGISVTRSDSDDDSSYRCVYILGYARARAERDTNLA